MGCTSRTNHHFNEDVITSVSSTPEISSVYIGCVCVCPWVCDESRDALLAALLSQANDRGCDVFQSYFQPFLKPMSHMSAIVETIFFFFQYYVLQRFGLLFEFLLCTVRFYFNIFIKFFFPLKFAGVF